MKFTIKIFKRMEYLHNKKTGDFYVKCYCCFNYKRLLITHSLLSAAWFFFSLRIIIININLLLIKLLKNIFIVIYIYHWMSTQYVLAVLGNLNNNKVFLIYFLLHINKQFVCMTVTMMFVVRITLNVHTYVRTYRIHILSTFSLIY